MMIAALATVILGVAVLATAGVMLFLREIDSIDREVEGD